MTDRDQRAEESARQASQMIQLFADFLPLGIILVDEHGRVLSANRAAQAMAREGDGLRLASDRLVLADPGEGRRLRAALRAVVAGDGAERDGAERDGAERDGAERDAAEPDGAGPDAAEAPGMETLNISRPSGRRPYRMLIFGIGATTDSAAPMRIACIALSDNEHSVCPEELWLESLFGLTRTEAKVASLLAGGASLEQITADLGIGMPTARTHLSRILDKTGASRQAELVRIILRSPAFLQLPRNETVGHGGLPTNAK